MIRAIALGRAEESDSYFAKRVAAALPGVA
jgi:hypothetical protein